MSHLFSLTPSVKVQRSAFDRSNNLKTCINSGGLYPIFFDEVLPGDTFNLNASLFCRMATPIVPVMDNLYLETFFFFVPNRLVWNNWQKFMGEQVDPGDSIDFTIPQIGTTIENAPDIEVGSILDYFGYPTGVQLYTSYGDGSGLRGSALPIRAYYLIWNEWFRDENLQDSCKILKSDYNGVLNTPSGLPNGVQSYWKDGSILPRGKRHDYFTSCLPTPQKFEALSIPLTGNAPVYGSGMSLAVTDGLNPVSSPLGVFYDRYDHDIQVSNLTDKLNVEVGTTVENNDFNSTKSIGVITKDQATEWETESGLFADLSNVTAATINDLRTAFQIQRLLESQNRSGTRYTEILRGQFGVISPDARLQRPEYLGGSSARININPVQQTSATSATSPQGNLAAFGVCADQFNGFVKSFVEHGYIIGLANVRADLNYQQGLNRMWSRRTRYDFYWPTLAHLGEQAVLNKEIYAQGTDDDNGVFGYQERWAEYRYKPNMITSKMRSTYATSLDIWHLGQKFDSLPALSDEFIQDHPPISRVIAVPSEPEFLLDVYFKLKCVRPMPVYSVPGLIDHF